jgi:hypothetical protein
MVVEEIDEDTVKSQRWKPPASYGDVIEVAPSASGGGSVDVFEFRRVVARAPGQRIECELRHDYLKEGRLGSPALLQLRKQVESSGGYWEQGEGVATDLVFIYLPPGKNVDLRALLPSESD